MVNFELQQKIIDCTATWEELQSFFPQDKQYYDLDNSFDKYFSVEKVKNALSLYYDEEISENYLSSWATAYNWILLASHWNTEKRMQNLKDNLIEKIGDCLDSLSFGGPGEYDLGYLQDIYDMIKMFYQIYTTLPQWETYYCEDWDCDGEEYTDVYLLCVNETHKLFLTFNGVLEQDNELANNMLTPQQYNKKIQELKDLGYWEDSLSSSDSFIPD